MKARLKKNGLVHVIQSRGEYSNTACSPLRVWWRRPYQEVTEDVTCKDCRMMGYLHETE